MQGRQFQRSQIKKKKVDANNMTVLHVCNYGETKSFLRVLVF